MTSLEKEQNDLPIINEMADFWHYKIGTNIFPLDGDKKTYVNWSQYKAKAVSDELHEDWKKENRYVQGLILMPGKVERGEKKGYIL